ncbi:hypothetical protein [Moorena producens]|uniref:hypothetical protein n=1 Tax=Moorena producens TaxID=1155739 RepID=UPI0011EA6780|nr:hypothetical protein [Moorena producens]
MVVIPTSYYSVFNSYTEQSYTAFLTYSLFPVPCSLFPVPCSLFPVPCSLFPTPYSVKPTISQTAA